MSALRFPDHSINFFKSYFSRSFQVNIKDIYLFHELNVDLGLCLIFIYRWLLFSLLVQRHYRNRGEPNQKFSDTCHWCVDNKLSNYFRKTRNMYTIWHKTDLIKSVDLILGMVKYILSNITQWHILLVICCNSFWRVNGFECYKQN